MHSPPANLSGHPLLALCPSGNGLKGLALDVEEPFDAARPCRFGSFDNALSASLPTATTLFVTDEPVSFFERLQDSPSALPIPEMFAPAPKEPLLRLFTIKSMNNIIPVDRCQAFILGALSLPRIGERTMRHGLTLLWLDSARILAALVFQNALHALAELSSGSFFQTSGTGGAAALAPLIGDFQLGWLPREEAERRQGRVWRAEDLPSEAEGFKPLVAAGPEAERLAGYARLLTDDASEMLCRGALHCYLLAAQKTVCQNSLTL